ncbi:MAG: glycosyltransferase family 39 protein [Bacteroidales bacterium]|nr:glycosyltransferase family 39 protein [Bacteroidales bacterium]
MRLLNKYWNEKPYLTIIIIALFVRIIAAIFSQGYGFHDDHFLVIEAAQSWVDKSDNNTWLPEIQKKLNPDKEPIPQGHSFLYVGIHYLLLSFLKFIGVNSPVFKMFLIRLIHAFFSIIIVITGYKIAYKLSNQKSARQIGLLLAVLWFMPFFSVRNLVEFVCIPLIMWGLWLIFNSDTKKSIILQYFISGLIMGLAFSVRFQIALFIGGVGLAILIQKKWKESIIFGFGVIISIFSIQGIIDYIIWDRPFTEFFEYVRYNIENKYSYGTNNWSMYILVILGLLIPPLSIFWTFGFFRVWKKHLLLFLPTFIFILFHTYFPNKQERFILPIITIFLITGIIGWNEFIEKSKFWKRRKKIMTISLIFFWIINLSILPILTTTYTKKSRVESMDYLSKYKDIKIILCEDTNNRKISFLPQYYLGKWIKIYYYYKHNNIDPKIISQCRGSKFNKTIYSYKYFELNQNVVQPDFILFFDDINLEKRVNEAKKYFPDLKFETIIKPGFIDIIMRKLNPKNTNQPIYIYKVIPSY